MDRGDGMPDDALVPGPVSSSGATPSRTMWFAGIWSGPTMALFLVPSLCSVAASILQLFERFHRVSAARRSGLNPGFGLTTSAVQLCVARSTDLAARCETVAADSIEALTLWANSDAEWSSRPIPLSAFMPTRVSARPNFGLSRS